MIRPLQDRVLIKKIKESEETTKSGIVLINNDNSRVERYTVVEVGPGIHTEKEVINIEVSIGQTVLVDKFSGQEFTEDDVSYKLVRQADILAVIE